MGLVKKLNRKMMFKSLMYFDSNLKFNGKKIFFLTFKLFKILQIKKNLRKLYDPRSFSNFINCFE